MDKKWHASNIRPHRPNWYTVRCTGNAKDATPYQVRYLWDGARWLASIDEDRMGVVYLYADDKWRHES